jgi:serine/threonine protein kinase
MASVWLALDERLGRPVAVKLLSDHLAHDESYLSRFRREARVAARLSHPNLVKVYDYGGEAERPYLVMEFVAGDTLAGGSPTEFDPHRLARELLSALHHIHAAGIVHRDIKPGNVLMAPDSSAKVTDFGIAQPEDATRLTSTGLVLGTRNYIAPEVLRGGPASPRADLYSCGILLQEVCGDALPSDLTSLVLQLTAEDPARRPESASVALASLTDSATPRSSEDTATAPTVAQPPDRPRPTISSRATAAGTRYRRWLLGGLAFVAGVVIAGTFIFSGADDPPSTEKEQSNKVGTEDDPRREQAETAERPTSIENKTDSATPPAESSGAVDTAPGQSKKVKPAKPPKSQRGKAKGHRKH